MTLSQEYLRLDIDHSKITASNWQSLARLEISPESTNSAGSLGYHWFLHKTTDSLNELVPCNLVVYEMSSKIMSNKL